MTDQPRLALGTLQAGADGRPVCWALRELLSELVSVQSFCSQARLGLHVPSGSRHGKDAPRHLDSWLMTRGICRELFRFGCRGSDLALVCGSFADEGNGVMAGGRLETLCRWLDLPALGIVDVSRLETCRLPDRPERLDGLLLDRVPDAAAAQRIGTNLETIWGLPVLGWLPVLPELRALVSGLPDHGSPCDELCTALAASLAESLQVERLLVLSARGWSGADSGEPALALAEPPPRSRLTVAVAYDDAFHGYFPDTLDLLETRGAAIRDFSPLKDEELPADTDVVYLGCGSIECYAPRLAANCCLKQSLRMHAAAGRRIYAECSGLAYLCEALQLEDGRQFPMAGVLPATARQQAATCLDAPVEVELAQSCWLGEAGTNLRGYLNRSWDVEAHGPLTSFLDEEAHRLDLFGRPNVVASRIHLNFAARPPFLDRFFQPAAAGSSLR